MKKSDINNEEEGIITLLTIDGEAIEFLEVAGIAYNGKFYAILQPFELPEGMEDDEALVFEVGRGEDGNDDFSLVIDDDIINAVFAEYNKLLDDAINDD